MARHRHKKGTYKIVRMYFDNSRAPSRRTVKTGLTLEQARRHCQNPETSSRTARSAAARARTRAYGPWFDAFDEE